MTLRSLKQALVLRLRQFHADTVSGWLHRVASRPLAVSDRPTLVFAPHPDDETLGCGGLIALKRERNVPVTVVILTDGSQARAAGGLSGEALVRERRQEARAALAILGVGPQDILFLDQPDAGLSHLPQAAAQRLEADLEQMLRRLRPGEVLVPHRHDGHADHEATFRLVQAVLARSGLGATVLEYPIWLFWNVPLLLALPPRALGGARRLSTGSVQNKKERAIAAYGTQLVETVLPQGFLRRFFRPYELFFLID